jgi:hypothetical protein
VASGAAVKDLTERRDVYLTENDAIGAEFSPGFSRDPTYWRVFIGQGRRLRQEVVVTNFEDPDKSEVLRYAVWLSRRQMADVWNIIKRIGFEGFERSYSPETIHATDCESYRIRVRFGKRTKEVEVYDPYRFANFEYNAAAAGFLELWEAIHQHAPHGRVPIEQGRPKPWWRFW